MGTPSAPISGILNLNKPEGMTSHDVVDRIRRASRQRRVGHAGTLDPTATGVLLVCVGQATRVAEYLMLATKGYRARAVLGIATDTYDAEGKTVSERPVPAFTWQQLESHLVGFLGAVEQTPPMFSAVKVEGQPLYRLARRGITIQRAPRRVTIHRIELLRWESPYLDFTLECSSGTYVRSIAHDLGQILGCGAHLVGLVRVASGEFRLEDAHTLEAVEAAFTDGHWQRIIHPLDEALSHFPAITLADTEAYLVRHGQPIEAKDPSPQSQPPEGTSPSPQLWRAYSSDGDLLALLCRKDETNRWWPKKVFASTV